MTPIVNKKIIRAVVGALLQSNLSAQDLRNFSLNRNLQEQTFNSLRSFLHTLEDDLFNDRNDRSSPPNEHIEIAYEAVQRRRISKHDLRDILRSTGHMPEPLPSKTLTVRDMLTKFFESATSSERKQLLDKLLSTGIKDAYLEGILRRKG